MDPFKSFPVGRQSGLRCRPALEQRLLISDLRGEAADRFHERVRRFPSVAERGGSTPWHSVDFLAAPIGSVSTRMVLMIMCQHRLKPSFVGFVKAAAPFAVAQLILAVAYVLIFLR